MVPCGKQAPVDVTLLCDIWGDFMDTQSVMLTEFESLKKSGNYPAALELILKQTQEGQPASPQYLVEVAELYKLMRRFSDAADWFRRAIQAGDHTKHAYFEQSACLMEAGRVKEAETEIQHFLNAQYADVLQEFTALVELESL